MKKVLKITESQYKSLLLSEQGDEKEFKMDYKKLKNNPSPEYIASVIKNSKGKWNDEEAWAQSAFEAIKDEETYNKVKQILKSDPYKFVKSFMDTDEDYHKNGNTIDKLYYKIYNLKGAETPFKMDYKKLKNNPSPKYIADVLEKSRGGLGNDKEAWAQAAFESIKNQETYRKVQEFMGENDPYEFVKTFMSTNIDYNDNGNTIDKLYDKLFPENPRFHFICNDLSARKSEYGTIPKHDEKCYSCGKELRQYCSSKGMVATLKTMKGSDWDAFFGYNSEYELPIYGGHWDNDEYTYCVCAKGETKKSGNDYYFLEDKGTYISAAPSDAELRLIKKQRLEYLKKIKENIDAGGLSDAFDCSVYRKEGDEKDWWKYQQCVTENASMAVSVVPVIGTAASAILDIVNAVSYLGSAFLGSSEEIQSEDFLMAAISLGSVLPVFGEVRSVAKIAGKEAKAAQNIIKELKVEGLKNLKSAGKFDDSFNMLNNTYTKHTSKLSNNQKNNVNKLLNSIGKINAAEITEQAKVLKDILEIYKKKGLKKIHLEKLLKDTNFINLLKKNNNDLSKTLKTQRGKEMISNIIIQTGVGFSMASFITKLKKVEKETEKRRDSSLKSLGYSDEEIAKIEREVQAKVTINLEEEAKIYKSINKKYENAPSAQELKQETKDIMKNIKVNMVIKESVDTLNKKGDTTNITSKMVVDTAVVVSKTSKWVQNFDYLEIKNEQNTIKMKNKIIITESQYKRLFLEQSSKQECLDDENSNKLLSFLKNKYSDKNPKIYAYDSRNNTCVIKLTDVQNVNVYLQVSAGGIVIAEKQTGYYYKAKFEFTGGEIIITEQPIPDTYEDGKWNHGSISSIKDIFNKYEVKPTKSREESVLDELITHIDNNNCDTIKYLAVHFRKKSLGHDTFCKVMKKFKNDYKKTPKEIMKTKGGEKRKGCFNNDTILENRYKLIVDNEKYFNEKCNK